MAKKSYSAPVCSARGTSIWAISRDRSIVWCRSAEDWRRVRRWQFSQPYATVFYGGSTTEVAFSIPRRKEAFARCALGLPAKRWTATPAQRAYHQRLRDRAVGRELFGRKPPLPEHEDRYDDDGLPRGEAQP